MTVLDQIKKGVARNLEWWDDEPAKIAMYVSAVLVSTGNTTERVDAQLITCKECRFKARDGDWCYREAHEFAVEPDGFCAWAERSDA